MKNVPKKKIALSLIVGTILTVGYLYFALPPLNLQDPAFYLFIGLILAVFCVLCILRKFGVQSLLTPQGIIEAGKDCCTVPGIILGVLIVTCILGGLIKNR